MFWWLSGGAAHKVSVQFTLALSLRAQVQSSAILSGIPTALPPLNYARSPRGDVLMANGIIPLAKWNGLRLAARNVGVPAPLNAPVLTTGLFGVSTLNTITGTYQVYQRFVDDDGNPSNLSPVSNTLEIATDMPIGLITVSGLDVPTDPKIIKRQLLRNTDGQFLTFYVEYETADLGSTHFALAESDERLVVNEAVPLFNTSNQPLAQRFGIPPSWMSAIAVHRSRAFLAGATNYNEGSIELTNGSAAVRGVGTGWIQSFVERIFYVQGDPTSYFIDAVDEVTQTITLSTPYPGASTYFGLYTISPPPAEKNLVYFSESDSYDAWSPFNALGVEENGDEITALLSNDSFLYILQRRHTFRMSYLNSPFPSPFGDGAIFPSVTRGAVNQAVCVQLDGIIYTLDEQGIYSVQGSSVDGLSEVVQNLFWLDRTDLLSYEYRINWPQQAFFHAQHNYEETTIRWYVAMSGDRLPQHAICYNYRSKQWWLEEYPYSIGGSASSLEPHARPLLCGPSKKIFFAGHGTTDGADPYSGTTRGTVTSATRTSFTDTTAAFATSGLVGEPVVIFDGAGKTESRIISSVSGQTVNVTQPFTIHLDATSEYQLGGIQWKWRSGWYRWVRGDQGEETNSRRIETLFEPCQSDAQMDIRLYVDAGRTPKEWSQNYPITAKEYNGITIEKGNPDVVVGLSYGKGFAQVRMDGHRDQFLNEASLVSLEMRGVSAENIIRIYQVTIEGAQ